MPVKNGNGEVDESFGSLPEATVDERVEAGRKLATQLMDKVKGYTYRLKTQKSTKNPNETYVNLYINGKAGARPGRIGIGRFATPIVFPGQDESDTEAFINATDEAGVKLKVYTITAD